MLKLTVRFKSALVGIRHYFDHVTLKLILIVF